MKHPIGQTARECVNRLNQKFEPAESHFMVRVLMEDLFGIDRAKIVLEPDLCIDDEQTAHLDKCVNLLLQGHPLQYVVGEMEFFGLRLKVTPDVLIPRPETEEMVGLICRSFNRDSELEILDLGTGSGCIAISLASFFVNSRVTATDISGKALGIAKQNATLNNVELNLIEQDMLATSFPENRFDLIASNPPYVCKSEKELMLPNVLEHEPHSALFVSDDDPLLFYRQIAATAYRSLKKDGVLWVETNERFGNEVRLCCLECGFGQAEVIKDFKEKNRFCKATRT